MFCVSVRYLSVLFLVFFEVKFVFFTFKADIEISTKFNKKNWFYSRRKQEAFGFLMFVGG